MTFAEKLQKLRKQNGLSQERLAEKLNVSRQAVSKWEMGTIPDMENMVKLGRYFDCSLDYLMKDEVDTDNDQDTNNHNMDRKNSNGSIIERCISITCIMIGGIFAFLCRYLQNGIKHLNLEIIMSVLQIRQIIFYGSLWFAF